MLVITSTSQERISATYRVDGFSRLFFWSAVDMSRSLSVISVNEGRAAGSADQHSSISDFHPESQCFGIAGLNVLFTIPP